MRRSIVELPRQLRAQRPLIHCITNPISIHQCANALLAVGARPIMAEHPREVGEITGTAQALLLNLGNITDVRMESMRIAARTARERDIPVVLDAVGAACSTLRREYAHALMAQVRPAVVKGNYSEITALCRGAYRAAGVDAEETLDVPALDRTAVELARRAGTVVLASGAVDVVTDGTRLLHLKNGTPQLAEITGTGCMLGALCASCLAAGPALEGAAAACAMLGIGGQLARTERGTGSFQLNLMDALSTLTAQTLDQYLELEEISIEAV